MDFDKLKNQIFNLCKECKLPYPSNVKIDKENNEDYLILSFNTSNDDFNNFDIEKVFITLTNNQINNLESVKTNLMKLYNSIYNNNINLLNKMIPNYCPIKYLELYNTSKNIYDKIIKNPNIPIPTNMYNNNEFRNYFFNWENVLKIEFMYHDDGYIMIDKGKGNLQFYDKNNDKNNDENNDGNNHIIKSLETFFESYYPI